jgi:hypothetical protein
LLVVPYDVVTEGFKIFFECIGFGHIAADWIKEITINSCNKAGLWGQAAGQLKLTCSKNPRFVPGAYTLKTVSYFFAG